ncbi:MAG: HAD family hydrolase [Deltaproteobacteria bacterium]|nr:MAG: HAD family hydrolase [Deltaproteobacteria bacterium]
MKTCACYICAVAPIIALFDIDGTLLRAGGAGRRAVELALDEVLDDLAENVSLQSVEFAGRTDPWIVRTALLQYGVAADDALVHEVLRRYVEHLPRQLELASAFEVLPGVLSLLSELSARDDVVLGLGTGNTEPAAYAKLARGGLDSFFAFGGFGSDHTDRTELLRAGLKRGLARAGALSGRAHVVVIGDTPHDVAAARAIGALCVAVSTGGYDGASLEAAGATVVVSDLRSTAVRSAFDPSAAG